MSLEDPFFVVKDEVLKALLRTRELFSRFAAAAGGGEDNVNAASTREWAATELRNALRSIEWDLEDLDDTVRIVERNPAKFRAIAPAELAARRAFIAQTRAEVEDMKARAAAEAGGAGRFGDDDDPTMQPVPLGSPTTSSAAAFKGGGGYSRVAAADFDDEDDDDEDGGATAPPSSSLTALRQQQSSLLRAQDEQLGAMSGAVTGVRDVSVDIGAELDEQAVMLEEFGAEIEQADGKLDATMRKMAKVLHMSNDRRQWMAIGVLSSTALVILMVILAL